MKAVKHLFALSTIATAILASGSAFAAEANGVFHVTVRVTPTCSVETSTAGMPSGEVHGGTGADIDFGNKASSVATAEARSKAAGNGGGIVVTCTKNTGYSIHLAPTSNSQDSGTGTMKGVAGGAQNTDTIAYSLYQDQSYSTAWGKDSNAKTNLSGTGEAQAHIVYAKIENNELNKPAGRYADSVQVTVKY